MFRAILFAAVAALVSVGVQAQTTLVYHNSSSGAALEGNLCNLKAAVRAGYAIRVLRNAPDGTIADETIHNARINGNLITGFTEFIGTTLVNGHWEVPTDPWISYLVLDTTGHVHIARMSVGSNVNRGYAVEYDEMRWFIDTPSVLGPAGSDSIC